MQLRDVSGERRQPRCVHLARLLVNQERGADFDDDAPEIFELRAGHEGSIKRPSQKQYAPLPDFRSGACMRKRAKVKSNSAHHEGIELVAVGIAEIGGIKLRA